LCNLLYSPVTSCIYIIFLLIKGNERVGSKLDILGDIKRRHVMEGFGIPRKLVRLAGFTVTESRFKAFIGGKTSRPSRCRLGCDREIVCLLYWSAMWP
jgi:hypothetical protein